MTADDATAYEIIAAERLALVARLRQIPVHAWATPSLCAGWTVHHVVAHLTTPFLVSKPQLLMQAARARGFAGALDRVAHTLAERSPTELLDVLEQNARSEFRPPGLPVGAPLVDIVVHGADIRWVLSDDHSDWGDPARLRPALDFLASTRARVGFLPRGRLSGVQLVATDQDWSAGTGASVRGSSLHLAMGALDRPAALPYLTGDGVALLAA